MNTILGLSLSIGLEDELIKVFYKHRNINEDQFKDENGNVQDFHDIFSIHPNKKALFKIGDSDKELFSRDFIKDIYCILIDFAEITEDDCFYEIKGVPQLRLMKRLPYMPDYANVYCFKSTKLGADWKGNAKDTLKHFIQTNDLFFDTFFEL